MVVSADTLVVADNECVASALRNGDRDDLVSEQAALLRRICPAV